MDIHIEISLGEIPAVASQRAAMDERRPRHSEFRDPTGIVEHLTDLVERLQGDVYIDVSRCPRPPGIEPKTNPYAFRDENRRMPAQFLDDRHAPRREDLILGERIADVATKLVR